MLDIPYKYKTLALFILIDQNVSLDIKVSKNNRIYTYKPSSLSLPFEDIWSETPNVEYVPPVNTEDFFTVARTNLPFAANCNFINGTYQPNKAEA